MFVNIDNEVVEIDDVYDNIISGEGKEWYVFNDYSDAESWVSDYFWDMVHNDPNEFKCYVGDDALIQWCLGQYHNGASSLDEWIDNVSSVPEEFLSSYDGNYQEGTVSKEVQEELGLSNKHVVYFRCN